MGGGNRAVANLVAVSVLVTELDRSYRYENLSPLVIGIVRSYSHNLLNFKDQRA